MKKRVLLTFLLITVFLLPVYSLKIVDVVPFSIDYISPGIIEIGKGTVDRKLLLYKSNEIYDYSFNRNIYELKLKKDCVFFKLKDTAEWNLWFSKDLLKRQKTVQVTPQKNQKTGKINIPAKNKIIQVSQSNLQPGIFSSNLRNINFSNLLTQSPKQSSLISFSATGSVYKPGKIAYRGGSIYWGC